MRATYAYSLVIICGLGPAASGVHREAIASIAVGPEDLVIFFSALKPFVASDLVGETVVIL